MTHPRFAAIAAAALMGIALPAVTTAQEQQAAMPPPVADTPRVSSTMPGIINMILVKVNGTPILLSELESEVAERLPLLQQQLPAAEIEAQMPLFRRDVLTGLIDQKMMLQRADQLGIVADANQVDAQIERMRQANGLETDEQFEAALQTMGLALEDIRERMRTTLRQQRLVFEEVQRGIFVSEAEINRYYEENPGEFAAPAQVKLEQLVFLTQGGNEATAAEQAAAAAAELRSGAPLDEVAARYPGSVPFAEDPGFVPLDDLQEALAAAVPDMPEGVFSDPVQSPFGFHVVRVAERQDQQLQPLEEARDQIRGRLTSQKSQQRFEQYVSGLRERTRLEILDVQYGDIEEAWKSRDDEATTAAR
jgi:peptidyl-prolyl cis-trans isomerase SurA